MHSSMLGFKSRRSLILPSSPSTITYIHTMLFAKIITLFAADALCTEAKVHPKPDPNAIG